MRLQQRLWHLRPRAIRPAPTFAGASFSNAGAVRQHRVSESYLEKPMSYVGDIGEIGDLLIRLRGCPGYEHLRREIRSSDWEQLESAFAVAKEADRLLRQRCEIEFDPTIIVGNREKTPDFRSKLLDRWVYFELKTSSMFHGEREFLEMQSDIHEACNSVAGDFKCIVQIHTDKFQQNHISRLKTWLTKRLDRAQNVLNLVYPLTKPLDIDGTTIAQVTVLGWLNRVIQAGPQEERMVPSSSEMTVLICRGPAEGGKAPFALLQLPSGEALLLMGREPEEYLADLTKQVFETDFETTPEAGYCLLNYLDTIAVSGNLVMGRHQSYDPHKRIKNKVDEAWEQLPEGEPNVVVFYSRQVIIEPEHIVAAASDLFNRDAYSKVSGLLYDVEMASGGRRSDLLINPRAGYPLKDPEIGLLMPARN